MPILALFYAVTRFSMFALFNSPWTPAKSPWVCRGLVVTKKLAGIWAQKWLVFARSPTTLTIQND